MDRRRLGFADQPGMAVRPRLGSRFVFRRRKRESRNGMAVIDVVLAVDVRIRDRASARPIPLYNIEVPFGFLETQPYQKFPADAVKSEVAKTLELCAIRILSPALLFSSSTRPVVCGPDRRNAPNAFRFRFKYGLISSSYN